VQNKADKKIWDDQANSINIDFYLNDYVKKPAAWHTGLVSYIDAITKSGDKVIEVGCSSGITTLMLDRKVEKTILDYSEPVLEKAKVLFSRAGQSVQIICADMFKIPEPDKKYDLVFNSGVIEHLDYAGRVAHMRENARIMKDGGTMVIAYPNHDDPIYRLSYLHLKKRGLWQYPDENKLGRMTNEIRDAGLILKEYRVLDPVTPVSFLFRHSRFKKPLYSLAKILNPCGYLMVLRLEKAGGSHG